DGYGDNWPIAYADLAPYYDKVESFIGVAGTVEHIPHLPDGKYLPPFALNCGERIVQKVAPTIGLGMRVIPKRAAQRTRAVNGLTNSSGVLGHYLMDNIVGPNVSGLLPQLRDKEVVNEDGKASGIDIVAYRNIDSRHPRFLRSYVHEGSSGARLFPTYARTMTGYGAQFKKSVRSWYTSPVGFNTRGEMLARYDNYIEIDKNVVDAWGIPALKIHCRWSDNEVQMARDA